MNKNPIPKLLSDTCICYTGICVFMILLQTAVRGSFADTAINSLQFFMFLPFSFALSLGNMCYRKISHSAPKRYLAHFVCFAIGFSVGIYMPYAIISKPSSANTFVVFLLCFAVYGIVILIHALIVGTKTKSQKQNVSYVNQFKKK